MSLLASKSMPRISPKERYLLQMTNEAKGLQLLSYYKISLLRMLNFIHTSKIFGIAALRLTREVTFCLFPCGYVSPAAERFLPAFHFGPERLNLTVLPANYPEQM